jgi:hypothetical protein
MPVVIEKVLPMSPVHLLPMSPVYTKGDERGIFFAAFAPLREIFRFFWLRLSRAGSFVLFLRNRIPVARDFA